MRGVLSLVRFRNQTSTTRSWWQETHPARTAPPLPSVATELSTVPPPQTKQQTCSLVVQPMLPFLCSITFLPTVKPCSRPAASFRQFTPLADQTSAASSGLPRDLERMNARQLSPRRGVSNVFPLVYVIWAAFDLSPLVDEINANQ